jgi:hypothetical protein
MNPTVRQHFYTDPASHAETYLNPALADSYLVPVDDFKLGPKHRSATEAPNRKYLARHASGEVAVRDQVQGE